jgi:hypothetical protein
LKEYTLERVANDFKYLIPGIHRTKMEELWYKQWRASMVEGEPKPITEDQTVEELKAGGIIGLYRKVEKESENEKS